MDKSKIFNIVKSNINKNKININSNLDKPITNNANIINQISFIQDNKNINENEEIKQDKYINLLLNPQIEFFCFFCKKDITKKIKFYCKQCEGRIFCIYCFFKKIRHNTGHKYGILDNTNLKLFNENFNIKQEYCLIYNLEKFGYSNWSSFIYGIDDELKKKCQSHYNCFYYKSKNNFLPSKKDIIIDEFKNLKTKPNKNVDNENIDITTYKSDEDQKAEIEIFKYIKNQELLEYTDFSNCDELIKYNNNREEFEYDLENEIVYLLSLLNFEKNIDDIKENNQNKYNKEKEFNCSKTYKEDIKYEDNDEKIKNDILADYNLILKEKSDKIRFIIDKNLFDLEKQNKIESKFSSDDFEILVLLKPFLKYIYNCDFFYILEGLLIQKKLKSLLMKLKKIKPKTFKKKNEKVIEDNDLPEEFNDKRIYDMFFTKGTKIHDEIKNLEKRILIFLNYEKIKENNKNNIFDEDEIKFIKERPLSISTFYDIKLNIEFYLKTKNGDLSNFLKNLLQNYDIAEHIKKEIFLFYINKIEKVNVYDNINDSKNNMTENNNIKDKKSIDIKKIEDKEVNTEIKNVLDPNSIFFYEDSPEFKNLYEEKDLTPKPNFYFQNKKNANLFNEYCNKFKNNNNNYYKYINNFKVNRFGINIFDNKNHIDNFHNSNYLKNNINSSINNMIYNNNNLTDINHICNYNEDIVHNNNYKNEIVTTHNNNLNDDIFTYNNNYKDQISESNNHNYKEDIVTSDNNYNYGIKTNYNISTNNIMKTILNKNSNIIKTHYTSNKNEDIRTNSNIKNNYDDDLDINQ